MDKTEIFLSTLGSFWRAIQITFFAYAGMQLLEHFGATQIEAAACILVASIFELGVLMNRTIGVVADSFHPKLDETSVLLGDLARHNRH
jgi:ABC-type Mn2+/Zn2+ transport system permease subunit